MVHAHHRSLHGAAVLVPCIVAIPLGTRCVDAQERANDGFVSLSQTVGDVTVRITAVKWCRKQDLGKRLGSGDDPRDKGLAIWYEVESDHPALEGAPGKKLTDHLTKITTLSELGRPLAQEWHKDRQYVWWRGVDPRWKTAIVQFELFDPRAPPEATGEFNDPLEFKGIPIPEAQASIIEVNHTLRTPRGTPVTLEKVGLRTKRHKEILFVIRWLPPEGIPDLHAHPTLTDGRVMDDKGIELPARGRGWHAGDDLEGKPGRETLRAPAQFTPGARTCDVTMRVEEGARSLRQDKWYRTFRFELKLSQVPFASHKSAPPPIAAATGEHADVTLESLEPMLSS